MKQWHRVCFVLLLLNTFLSSVRACNSDFYPTTYTWNIAEDYDENSGDTIPVSSILSAVILCWYAGSIGYKYASAWWHASEKTQTPSNSITTAQPSYQAPPKCIQQLAQVENMIALVPYNMQHAARAQAIARSYEHCPTLIENSLSVSPDMITLLKRYDIAQVDMNPGTMNPYQQQLHIEFVKQIKSTVALDPLYNAHPACTLFIDAVGHGISLGLEANKSQELVSATHWASTGWHMLEITQAVGHGVGLGLYNAASSTAHMIAHPIITTQTLLKGIGLILQYYVQEVHATAQLATLYAQGNRQVLDAYLQKLHLYVINTAQQYTDSLAHVSTYDKVKYTTACATEIIAPARFFKIVHTLCKQMKNMVQLALSAAQEEVAIEYALSASSEVSTTAKLSVVSVKSESSPLVALSIETPRKVPEVSASPVARIVEKVITPLVDTWVDTQELADHFKDYVTFEGKSVRVDWEHLFSIKEKHGVTRAGNKTPARLYGWHHDYMKTLELQGIVEHKNIVLGPCGTFESTPMVKGIQYGRKTFFPSTWTEKKIGEKIYEAFKYALANQTFVEDDKGFLVGLGKTTEEFFLQIYFDPARSIITSIFPIIKP